MRLRRKAGTKEKLLAYEDYVLTNPQDFKGKWQSYFDNDHEIHVELGTGKGQFITNMAERNPHINYISVEVIEEVLIKAVQKAQAKELKNIVFLLQNVSELEDFFAEEELSRIYLNFSDPWPRSKHAKRRLTYRGFLEVYKKLLKKDGEIHFKTDNEKLFEFSLNEFSYCDIKLKNITFDLHNSKFEGNVMTEYEEKFTAMGMKIYRCEGLKRS